MRTNPQPQNNTIHKKTKHMFGRNAIDCDSKLESFVQCKTFDIPRYYSIPTLHGQFERFNLLVAMGKNSMDTPEIVH